MTDRIFLNGRFYRPGVPGPDATSLLSRGGKILAWDADSAPPGTEVVDLSGRTVIPGPVDAHCHLVTYGMQARRDADLRGTGSLGEISQRLTEHSRRHGFRPGDGRWLTGRGFDQEPLPGRAWPTRHDLDRIAADRPVCIVRVCGHALVANTAALQAAGLDPAEAEDGFPEGGRTENRMGAIYRAIPDPTADDWQRAAEWACDAAAKAGFVGIHSLMADGREVRALVDLHRTRGLPVRVLLQLPYSLLAQAAETGMRTGFGDDYLSIGAIKLFSDGSLGARTAALEEPYTDDPGTSGELIYEPAELSRRVTAVYAAGFQVCIHAIGDRAMRVVLDAMEEAAKACPPLFPPRIEHASLVNPELVRRMRDLGVAAAVQPQFACSDHWTPQRLGTERSRGCYAFRTLWKAGIPLAGSTDCPVERLDALAAIGQLVHRSDWSPDEGIPLEDALRVFSEGSYALRGLPAGSGALQIGRPADFVVLEEDPRSVPAAEIERIPVAMTVVGGRPVYVA